MDGWAEVDGRLFLGACRWVRSTPTETNRVFDAVLSGFNTGVFSRVGDSLGAGWSYQKTGGCLRVNARFWVSRHIGQDLMTASLPQE